MYLIYGILYGIVGQILSFVQLQCAIKWGWWDKYPVLLMTTALPALWFYMKSVNNFITHFGGEIYQSRLIGFAIGIIVFIFMSKILFNEAFTMKVFVSVILAAAIVLIQVYWK